MPYIKETKRLDFQAQPLDEIYINNPGELNYLITYLCDQYWQQSGNYQGINDIVGALEGAKMEFYRRVAAPYENVKSAENGDVYNV